MNTPASLSAVERRYREAMERLPRRWPKTVEGLLAHRSVRSYLAKPLPSGTLELLVAAAQSASTSSNKQFWSVVAVEDAGRKQRLAKLCASQMWLAGAPLVLAWIADLSRITEIGESRGVALDGVNYLESFLVAVVDATLAAQNAAVAAESMGLGIVYIGAMRDRPLEVAEELGLPPRCFAIFGMCVGYPDAAVTTDVKPRLPQSAVLHRERYAGNAWADALARYVDSNNAFRAEQGMAPLDWDQQTIGRVKDADALKGRHDLLETLRRMGFELK